jgi:hypothetical protein
MAAVLNDDLEWQQIVADYPDVARAFPGVPDNGFAELI